MNIADEIEKLDALRQSGGISEEEYQKAKKSVLEQQEPTSERSSGAGPISPSDANTWGMLIHLSQFCGYIVPIAVSSQR